MTVCALQRAMKAEILTMPDPEREITGGYAGDLLSWVMGRAKEGQMWVTIMTNINVLAVATLIGLSCVVLAENAEVSPDFIKRAEEEGINLLRTAEDTYAFCCRCAGMI